MGKSSTEIEVQRDEKDPLALGVSDEELEAAASRASYPAMTFPAAPTVSVLFACCGNDYHAGTRKPD
jgi:hypothetical protein